MTHAERITEKKERVVEAAKWSDAETTRPPTGRQVICEVIFPITGKHGFMTAEFVPRWTLLLSDECEVESPDYDEKGDEYYCPEGWYAWCEPNEISWLVTDKVIAWLDPRTSKASVDALLALERDTCPECGWTGDVDGVAEPHCPEGCDNGRKRA